MNKKRTFDNILDDVQVRNSSSATDNLPDAQINYKIPGALKRRLDRAVYHKGPQMSQRAFLAQALEAYLNTDPDADKPVPGEK